MKKVLIALAVIFSIALAAGLFVLGVRALDIIDKKISSSEPVTTGMPIINNAEGTTGAAQSQNGSLSANNKTSSGNNGQSNAGNDQVTHPNAGQNMVYEHNTLEVVNSFDYFHDSITGVSDTQFTEEELQKALEINGTKYTGTPGMPIAEYKEAMEHQWVDVTEHDKEIEQIDFNITDKYPYATLENFLHIMSRYEGVYLYDIGTTTAGRTMYALEIDVPSGKPKQTVMLTGTIHARETAGTTFLFKELINLLQNDTAENRTVLENLRIASVLCVNPDGREGVAFDTSNYKYANGELWKATSNGTDLNRNFPGLSFSQIAKGNKKSKTIGTTPTKLYYPGDYGGSTNEVKALMKFLYHYVVHEKAPILIDYHQQGLIGYAGKPWDTKAHQDACKGLANQMFSMMNVGNSYKYRWVGESDAYGLEGMGSTLTDFASSAAYGAKFSPAYGFYVYTDGVKEYPLSVIPRMDESDITFDIPNDSFRTMTFEIGYGAEYLGYSDATLKLLDAEYENYHFDSVLYRLYEILYGI